jgi:hypothetical protein
VSQSFFGKMAVVDGEYKSRNRCFSSFRRCKFHGAAVKKCQTGPNGLFRRTAKDTGGV